MKGTAIVDAIERFFLDLIGSVVPGAVLLSAAWVLFQSRWPEYIPIPPASGSDWAIVVVTCYLLGHFIAGLERPVIKLLALVKRTPLLKRLLPANFKVHRELLAEVSESRDFEGFADLLEPRFPWLRERGASVVHPARNLAISLVPEYEGRIFRFMFLSLLAFGTTSALFLALLTWAAASLLGLVRIIEADQICPFNWIWLAVWLGFAFVLAERGFTFRSITLRVPFSMATIAVLQGALKKSDEDSLKFSSRGDSPTLYLAGGFHSGWQDRIAAVWKGALLDPRKHKLVREDEYTFWDLEAIQSCDWVWAYLEATNPGGYALALEIGFAKALGKRVILVDEKSKDDSQLRRYFGMIHACADVKFDSFEESVRFLETFSAPSPAESGS